MNGVSRSCGCGDECVVFFVRGVVGGRGGRGRGRGGEEGRKRVFITFRPFFPPVCVCVFCACCFPERDDDGSGRRGVGGFSIAATFTESTVPL